MIRFFRKFCNLTKGGKVRLCTIFIPNPFMVSYAPTFKVNFVEICGFFWL